MRTSEAGTSRQSGFTLLELLVVVAIMALATAGVGLALRDDPQTLLEREGVRLASLLEAARSQSRLSATPVRWRPTAGGFTFDGLPPGQLPRQWLQTDTQASPAQGVWLGPEPIIGRQSIQLRLAGQPAQVLTLSTDGVAPFSLASNAGTPLPP
ncbi:MAG: prepilin-type N-terminal cleavage/methylation domain-containing protein [Rhodoferax sp.]